MSTSNGSMQAALLYGPRHVALKTIPIPTLGATDVLVRIEAATTCGTDLKVFLQGGHARMITPPAVFGHEFSGTIVQVGAGVQHFREGMRVVANNSAPCYRCYYCHAGTCRISVTIYCSSTARMLSISWCQNG